VLGVRSAGTGAGDVIRAADSDSVGFYSLNSACVCQSDFEILNILICPR
jgi:hypothetical protein